MKPSANFIAAGNVMLPPHIVPIQLKNFTPVGTAMSIDRPEKYASVHGAGGEHVVGPHADRQRRDRERGQHQAGVAEHGPPGEHRQHLGDDAEVGQHEDVHLGVAEEPEQVLPQDRLTAAAGSKMWAPRWRSANSIAPALVSIGNAISTSTLVTSMFQVKIGMRNIVMPGARIVSTVATMLTAVSTPDRPVSTTAMIHRSAP